MKGTIKKKMYWKFEIVCFYDWEKYNDDKWCRKQKVSMEQIDIIIANVLGEVSL